MSLAGINLASRALQTHQRSLEVVGQNIANVETPGYSRQVAVTRAVALGAGADAGSVAVGGGVDIASIHRAHAGWLQRAAETLQAQVGQSSVASQYAGRLEPLFGEPTDAGLQAGFDRFFAAYQDLAARPHDMTARDGVARAGTDLARKFRELTDGMGRLRSSLRQQVEDGVAEANRLVSRLGGLGRSIREALAAGSTPNELLDERDELVSRLARLTGATATGEESGELIVSLGGRTLVQGSHVEELELVPGTLSLRTKGGEAVTPAHGELRGLQEWAGTVLPGYEQRLAEIRDRFAGAVNGLHQSGRGRDGRPGLPFFVADARGDLALNPALLDDARRIVAGDGSAGDGRIAQAIADLRSAADSGVAEYRVLVGDLGAETQAARQGSQQAEASLQQVLGMRAEQSGVNLDEELAQMVSLQKVYAASARLLTVFDEMLQTLIQRTGA